MAAVTSCENSKLGNLGKRKRHKGYVLNDNRTKIKVFVTANSGIGQSRKHSRPSYEIRGTY